MKPKLLLVFLLLLANLTAKSYALGINVVEVPAPNIEFADANVKAICVANWDTNNDGELSEEEAVAVIDLGTVFKYNTQITSFDELQYFTGLTSIGYQAFSGCRGLTSVTIPPSSVRAFELNFGSEEAATRIDTLAKENEAGTWYTLQGVRLDGQPTETGVYLNGTKKVFIP